MLLGLPVFTAGSVALGLTFMATYRLRSGGALPIIYAGTGIGLLGPPSGHRPGPVRPWLRLRIFAGFWLSYSTLLLGLQHNWFGSPRGRGHSVAAFLITWLVITGCLLWRRCGYLGISAWSTF